MSPQTKKASPKPAKVDALQSQFKKLRIKPQDIRDAVAWARGKKEAKKA